MTPDTEKCWVWPRLVANGYARLMVNSRMTFVHRVMYEIAVGPIPEGLVIDHVCRNRGCVNPFHLEPVTHAENLLRSPITVNSRNSAKTHCPQGHPYDEENTYWKVRPHLPAGGSRVCRACARERARRRWKALRDSPRFM